MYSSILEEKTKGYKKKTELLFALANKRKKIRNIKADINEIEYKNTMKW